MKKTTPLLVLSLFSFSLLSGQCLSGDCLNGHGVLLFAGGDRYIGQFHDGKMDGEGIFYYFNGGRYDGQWSQGQPNGEGVRIMPDGDRRQGIWEMGKFIKPLEQLSTVEVTARGIEDTGCISGDCHTGKGIYIYPSGAIYIGEFANGEIHGVGVCYYSDGTKYQGEWSHRYPEGKGTKSYPDGTRRTGFWKKGQPVNAQGRLLTELVNARKETVDIPDIQSGCISGDCSGGQGVFAYPDGSRYEGQFYLGKPEGWGSFFYANGEKYTGGFRSGYPHGQGKLVRADGSLRTGRWENGEYRGTPPPATAPTGCVTGDCVNGFGTYVFKDGSRYVGSFRGNLPHGQGTVYYANGERYEGAMTDGTLDGEGTLFLADGSQVSGYWRRGAYAGAIPKNQPRPSPEPQAEPFTSPSSTRPKTSVRVWAVIIGISSYNHMPVLRYTDDDAYRIYAFLKSPEGGALEDSQIRILIDEDATKKKILDAMAETFGKAGPNDLVFLYFSGHGLKGSFLPFDFDGYNNKIFHEEINDLLDRSPAKYKLCIADACHSGSLLAMRGDDIGSTLMDYYETLAKAQPGTALIMSSKSDETSLESSGLRQGVFSHFLIRGLKGDADLDGDRVVTIQELYNYVHQNVRRYTGNRQSPVIQGDYDRKMAVSVQR